jgi:hypothetical protein
MKWITRSHVNVDRVACPWLIVPASSPWLIWRFVDSEAEFMFVPVSRIGKVVADAGAIPFDAPGVELGHSDGDCSFQTIVKAYGLKDPALLLLADIVGCADTDRLSGNPVSAGLEALAVGFSLRYPDDRENLARQFEVYDSLYAWCRLEVARTKA